MIVFCWGVAHFVVVQRGIGFKVCCMYITDAVEGAHVGHGAPCPQCLWGLGWQCFLAVLPKHHDAALSTRHTSQH